MNDRFTTLLSAYLDHDLPRAQVETLEAHLETCASCRDVLAELAAVKSRAASLVDLPPPDDLWAGIASRIGSAGPTGEVPRPVVLELPPRARHWGASQWLAAAAVFVLVALGAVWFAPGGLGGRVSRQGLALRDGTTLSPSTGTDATAASFDADRIEGEIHELQAALDRGRGRLSPETVQVLEDNLLIIHKALADARTALQQDPANRELQDYFAGTVQRKLDMVRRAAELAGV